MRNGVLFGILALASVGGALVISQRSGLKGLLVTGKTINIETEGLTTVGSFPVNMAMSPDGKFIAVTNSGFRQQVSILDSESGALVSKREFNATKQGKKEALYYGVAFRRLADGATELSVSNGYLDTVTVFDLAKDGKLTEKSVIQVEAPKDASGIPHHLAGLGYANGGSTLLVAGNQSHVYNEFKGSLMTQSPSGDRAFIRVDGFPLAVVGTADGHAFVSSEMEGTVTKVNLQSRATQPIKTGENPSYLLLNKAESKLYVSNANSDTLSVIDTASGKVLHTVLLRPADYPSLPGSTPLGMALSRDERTLFVTMADLNAVAVVSLESHELKGYIPSGWYPTSVAVSPSGRSLFVANAKGTVARTANGKPVGDWGTYAPNILEGNVQRMDMDAALANLGASTEDVLRNNRATKAWETASQRAFTKPAIEHVIYVIKENRTYDQVFGEMKRGNGDPSLCLFPRAVTPNQHALAERFVLLDNFYVCAEVSADGWNWSTAGIANEYTQRNTFTNYSGRGRAYDFEGQTNGSPLDTMGKHAPAAPAGGYLWDQAAAQGVSMRNYGFFINNAAVRKDDPKTLIAEENQANQKALKDSTCTDFLKYNMQFADSEAWVKHGLEKAPRQLASFGSKNDPSRMTTWLREYAGFVKSGKMPKLMTVRLGRDHTSGTAPGQPSPRACVADNDYAVGQLVEAVSNSPFWMKTAIFILEDDAQAGTDHVDAHRSIAFVISPAVPKAKLDSSFYNTNSMLRTIGLVLGLKPWNQYIASAYPMNVFTTGTPNDAPYKAILPAREIIGENNIRTAYRAADSERLLDPLREESLPDFELNDILWGAIKGPHVPRPATRNTIWSAPKD